MSSSFVMSGFNSATTNGVSWQLVWHEKDLLIHIRKRDLYVILAKMTETSWVETLFWKEKRIRCDIYNFGRTYFFLLRVLTTFTYSFKLFFFFFSKIIQPACSLLLNSLGWICNILVKIQFCESILDDALCIVHFLLKMSTACVLTSNDNVYLTFQALDTFNTAIVSPIYYVMFTTLTIFASVIMFKVISITSVIFYWMYSFRPFLA